MEISKRQLIDLVKRAHDEGMTDAQIMTSKTHLPLHQTERSRLWSGSGTIYDLRCILSGGKPT